MNCWYGVAMLMLTVFWWKVLWLKRSQQNNTENGIYISVLEWLVSVIEALMEHHVASHLWIKFDSRCQGFK
jgi:predicted permease